MTDQQRKLGNLVDQLETLADTQAEVPGLTPQVLQQWRDLSNLCSEIKDDLFLQDIQKSLADLKQDSTSLQTLTTQMSASITKLNNIANLIQQVSNGIN